MVDQRRADRGTDKTDVVKSHSSIQTIKSIFSVNEEDRICLISLKNACHRMDHSFNARFLARTHLRCTTCRLYLRLQNAHDCLAANAPGCLPDPNGPRSLLDTICPAPFAHTGSLAIAAALSVAVAVVAAVAAAAAAAAVAAAAAAAGAAVLCKRDQAVCQVRLQHAWVHVLGGSPPR
jgi:hypothetical protein